MTSPLPPEREAEIRARAEAATEGPWEHQPWSTYALPSGDYAESILLAAASPDGELTRGLSDADGEFIAHSRTDVPDLLAEVDRLRDAIESIHHQDTVKAIFCEEDCRDHEDECPVQDLVVCAGCARLADDVDPYYADRPVPEGVIWPCATAAALAAPTPEEGDRAR